MKRFLKIILAILGLCALGLVIFVAIRIRENDRQAAVRQAEAEKTQISQSEAQQLDLGGFMEGDFRSLPEAPAGTPAPTPEQWRALGQGLSGVPALAQLLPGRAPVVASGFGSIRYAVRPDSWRLLIDCRREATSCAPVALSASALSNDEADEWQENRDALAPGDTSGYAALHGRKGTGGMDKLIKEGNIPMVYNEFCGDLGCNGSVSFAVGRILVKVEGGGDLQPWFSALARNIGQERKR